MYNKNIKPIYNYDLKECNLLFKINISTFSFLFFVTSRLGTPHIYISHSGKYFFSCEYISHPKILGDNKLRYPSILLPHLIL